MAWTNHMSNMSLKTFLSVLFRFSPSLHFHSAKTPSGTGRKIHLTKAVYIIEHIKCVHFRCRKHFISEHLCDNKKRFHWSFWTWHFLIVFLIQNISTLFPKVLFSCNWSCLRLLKTLHVSFKTLQFYLTSARETVIETRSWPKDRTLWRTLCSEWVQSLVSLYKRKPYCGKMNNAGDGDDEQANDDGGNSNAESVPAQPPGPIIVSVIIAVSGLRIRKYYYMSNSLRLSECFK